MTFQITQIDQRAGGDILGLQTTITLEGYGNDDMLFSSRDLWDNIELTQLIAPEKVVIRCAHCGQWGARRCACKTCGAPMPE